MKSTKVTTISPCCPCYPSVNGSRLSSYAAPDGVPRMFLILLDGVTYNNYNHTA